jgi:hypothetical protein
VKAPSPALVEFFIKMKQTFMQVLQITETRMSSKDPTLHSLVNDLINESAPLAVNNRNYIVNNIPADLCIETNSTMVSDVLNKIFYIVILHTQNSVILVSARVYGITVLVLVKSKGSVDLALPGEIGHACKKAQNTGGIIEMIQCESEQSSIAYCFLNVAGAA